MCIRDSPISLEASRGLQSTGRGFKGSVSKIFSFFKDSYVRIFMIYINSVLFKLIRFKFEVGFSVFWNSFPRTVMIFYFDWVFGHLYFGCGNYFFQKVFNSFVMKPNHAISLSYMIQFGKNVRMCLRRWLRRVD
eukprot:TRINITY_DN3300_c0_g1_i4.p1 TRINITY_DN3300_c0_g1~~TRINITY_DN3300_c0_g1_i4.p1  ORF type:complete len:134 (+),score=0.06 TRINITY_DN3300_c0_g1_i4:149-550(+)